MGKDTKERGIMGNYEVEWKKLIVEVLKKLKLIDEPRKESQCSTR
jgi:hypothetical protein